MTQIKLPPTNPGRFNQQIRLDPYRPFSTAKLEVRPGKVKKGDGQDVHHKDGNPRNNKKGNVKVVSRKKNRGVYRFA